MTFANEESAWTRKRNADFLALQLKVQQAGGLLRLWKMTFGRDTCHFQQVSDRSGSREPMKLAISTAVSAC